MTNQDNGKAAESLARLQNAIASNALSGVQVQSEAGRQIIGLMMAAAVSGDFSADDFRKAIGTALTEGKIDAA